MKRKSELKERQKAKGKRQRAKVKNDLNERLLEYGARVIKLVDALPRTLVARRIGDQLLRSAMAGGANTNSTNCAMPATNPQLWPSVAAA